MIGHFWKYIKKTQVKTIDLFNIKALNAFWAKALLFLLIFTFATATFASSMTIVAGDIEGKTLEPGPDSLSQNSDTLESARIYMSEGTTFYNTEGLNGNVEIIQKEKSTTVAKKVDIRFSKKIVKRHNTAQSGKEERYRAKVQFSKHPLGSNNIFSRSGGKVIVAPSFNPQSKIVALVVPYCTYFFFAVNRKRYSKYLMSFAIEISHWQMLIRPPPPTV